MRFSPSLDTVLALDGPESHVAITVSVLADTETPISIFQKLAGGQPNSFLLESIEGGELLGRYSFMGCGIRRRFEFRDGVGTLHDGDERRDMEFDDPLDILREVLGEWNVLSAPDLPRFIGGAVGYLGFDCIRYFENVPLPVSNRSGHPEGVMLLTAELYIYDHLKRRLMLVVHAPLNGDRKADYAHAVARLQGSIDRLRSARTDMDPIAMMPTPECVSPDLDELLHMETNREASDMMQAVRSAQESIEAGEVFQVVLSQRFTARSRVSPLALYRSLRALNPSPYMFYFDFGGFQVAGASPEVLVRLEDDQLLLRPIAGTRPRGGDSLEDQAHERDLLADEKELAEHRMLIDLGRNDLGRVATVGTVQVERPLHIERYSHVMHLVTDIRAQLADGLDAFDAFRAAFPAGTVSGAPKIRACELLATLEPDRRGLYAGAVGYFDVNGNMDTCIAIRTVLIDEDGVHVQAGAGIVHDSVPIREHEECIHKARACLSAISMAAAAEAS